MTSDMILTVAAIAPLPLKRALFVAGDREITRSYVTALLGEAPVSFPLPRQSQATGWTVARAHSILEAKTLIEFSLPNFDVFVIAPRLPDGNGLDLIEYLRASPRQINIPVVLMTQRGRDHHIRRIASHTYRVSAFVSLSDSKHQVQQLLSELSQPRHVLLVDHLSPELFKPYLEPLRQAHFDVTVSQDAQSALVAVKTSRPNVVAISLSLGGALDLCSSIKRIPDAPPVLLYGAVSSLEHQSIPENRLRADDFISSPISSVQLTERIASLVGWGIAAPYASLPSPTPSSPNDTLESNIVCPPKPQPSSITQRARRTERRVPCLVRVVVEDNGQRYLGDALDMSSGGLFVICPHHLEPESVIQLTFKIFSDLPEVTLSGRVAWITKLLDKPYGVGIELHGSTDGPDTSGGFHQLAQYVQQVSGILYQPG